MLQSGSQQKSTVAEMLINNLQQSAFPLQTAIKLTCRQVEFKWEDNLLTIVIATY